MERRSRARQQTSHMPNVFILATCRLPELLPFTTLVFKTIRVGFPTARIVVRNNFMEGMTAASVNLSVQTVGGEWEKDGAPTIHHEWIEALVKRENEPFWICDGDMVFYDKVEDWKFSTSLAGWRIPEWQDEFTKARTRARLHTSLLYIDPVKLRADIVRYESQFPKTVFNPLVNLFHPLCLPLKEQGTFYDTCSLLHNAVGGTAFTPQQLDFIFHFNFGTIPDVVLPHLSNGREMFEIRQAILNKPELGRGLWRAQMAYYEARRGYPAKPPLPVPEVTPENAKQALEWNVMLCKGDQEAMIFNDMWYRYCHAIDDLIDTMEDGRPMMNAEQMLEIFALAAMLYNSPFFVRHRDMLFPIVLQVTSAFADSVAWERSPIKHRRTISNVLSACGDELYFTVALICGGWSHMRSISATIRERDYCAQHDANGERT